MSKVSLPSPLAQPVICSGSSQPRELGQGAHALVSGVGGVALHQAAAAGDLLQGRVRHPLEQAALESLVEVAHRESSRLIQLSRPLLERLQLRGGKIAGQQRVERGFRGQHAALDGQVNAFEPLRVEEAGRVADDHPAVARQRRHRPPSAIRQRLGAVADHLAAFEQAAYERMLLEGLQARAAGPCAGRGNRVR